jgi:hypothetical protein
MQRTKIRKGETRKARRERRSRGALPFEAYMIYYLMKLIY